ncbi:MAG: hypothetical protein QXO76_11350 [Thermoproteota archaeon]
MNFVSRLGLFLILTSLALMLARQPFLDISVGCMFSEASGESTTKSRSFFIFTRAASIPLSVDVPRNVNSTLIFLTTPEEINTYLQNLPLTGVKMDTYEGSFSTVLRIAHRGIYVIILNFSPVQSLRVRMSSQGISESEYIDLLIILAFGILVLVSSFLRRTIRAMTFLGRR